MEDRDEGATDFKVSFENNINPLTRWGGIACIFRPMFQGKKLAHRQGKGAEVICSDGPGIQITIVVQPLCSLLSLTPVGISFHRFLKHRL